jgi:hypothetical protein
MNKLLLITLFISTAVFGFEEYREHEEDKQAQKKEQESTRDKLKNSQKGKQLYLKQTRDDFLIQKNSNQQQPHKEKKE